MTPDEKHALLALMRSPHVGSATVRHALALSRRLEMPLDKVLKLSLRQVLTHLPAGAHETATLLAGIEQSDWRSGQHEFELMQSFDVQVITLEDARYPAVVRDTLLETAPPVLFLAGNLNLLNSPMAAVVGARRVSPQGIAKAVTLAAEFAAWDAVTVSGGAEGIDQAAHGSAIGHGGATVIVLPMGILRRDAALLEKVDVAIGRSLYMSHTHPMNLFGEYTALERNAVVSALSRLVCVVEPGKTGGSIVTARCAIQQRRPLFVHHTMKEASILQPLFTAGAQSLTNDKGEIAWGEIKTAWDRPAVPPEQQVELF